MADQLLDNFLCIRYNNGESAFPCNASPIQAVSLGIAAGGIALIFTVFLMNKVRKKEYERMDEMNASMQGLLLRILY